MQVEGENVRMIAHESVLSCQCLKPGGDTALSLQCTVCITPWVMTFFKLDFLENYHATVRAPNLVALARSRRDQSIDGRVRQYRILRLENIELGKSYHPQSCTLR